MEDLDKEILLRGCPEAYRPLDTPLENELSQHVHKAVGYTGAYIIANALNNAGPTFGHSDIFIRLY
jgi:hypothetical protein